MEWWWCVDSLPFLFVLVVAVTPKHPYYNPTEGSWGILEDEKEGVPPWARREVILPRIHHQFPKRRIDHPYQSETGRNS